MRKANLPITTKVDNDQAEASRATAAATLRPILANNSHPPNSLSKITLAIDKECNGEAIQDQARDQQHLTTVTEDQQLPTRERRSKAMSHF